MTPMNKSTAIALSTIARATLSFEDDVLFRANSFIDSAAVTGSLEGALAELWEAERVLKPIDRTDPARVKMLRTVIDAKDLVCAAIDEA